ncbi:helix-turn-helix domain-containing protein [Marinicella sp. W31]|uniref:helix-turn-helix domain-containing protein n=1 Tax=Marinicella sp. W31 TaxID=3023713 RepID=UPI003756E56B
MPSVLYLLYSVVIWLADFAVLQDVYFYADGKDKDLKFGYQLVGFISMAIYLIKSIFVYMRYRQHTLNNTSFADTVSLSWVRYFLTALLIVVLLKVVVMILIPGWGSFGNHFSYYLIFSILFYFLAILGYSSSYTSNTHALPVLDQPETQFNVSDDDLKACADLLNKAMDVHKYYLNQKLTLSELSKTIEVSGRLVSKTVNQLYKMNFNDYINSYRVEAFIESYQNNSDQLKTMLDLAMDCGFNSKATFNRAFKKHTKKSPKSYFNA